MSVYIDHESPEPEGQVYVGITVTEDAAVFRAVLHARVYDGIRVEHKYDTAPVRLSATTRPAAQREAAMLLAQFRSTYKAAA